MARLLPLAAVPPSPGMFVVLIAVVEIGALGASPLPARGIVVGAMPASYPSEFPLRISPPTLKACLPFVQLNESPYVQRAVVSRYELVLLPPRKPAPLTEPAVSASMTGYPL